MDVDVHVYILNRISLGNPVRVIVQLEIKKLILPTITEYEIDWS